jgi:hypothetical protein
METEPASLKTGLSIEGMPSRGGPPLRISSMGIEDPLRSKPFSICAVADKGKRRITI